MVRVSKGYPAVLVAGMVFGSAAHAATVAFDNIGPTDSFNNNVYESVFHSSGTSLSQAVVFNASASGAVQTVVAPFGTNRSGTTTVNLALYSDGGTAPGLLLGQSSATITALGGVGQSTIVGALLTFEDWGASATVNAGDRYWLVAAPTESSTVYAASWHKNINYYAGRSIVRYESYGAEWDGPIAPAPGARIILEDDMSPVPLPASAFFLLLSLGGLAGFSRRKRRGD